MRWQGKIALDFQIAFKLGPLVERDPVRVYRIVCRDSGFDPLFRHWCERGCAVERAAELGAAAERAISGDRRIR